MKFFFSIVFLTLSYASQAQPRTVPTPIYGVTLDRINNLSASLTSLRNLAKMPTTRVVFDEGMPATYYQQALNQIYPVSYIMGEILDSYYVKTLTNAQYERRSREYVNLLKNKVDIWEIGNEVNGEWLGTMSSVVNKIKRAGRVVKAAGGKTALTLYYNDECYAKSSNEMFRWMDRWVDAEMRDLVDYVFVSYYECPDGGQPKPNWQATFDRVASVFPGKKIGIGEVGTTVTSKKHALIREFYSMKINTPNFVNGNFWWYFYPDMVPYTKSYWNTLNETIKVN